MIFFADASALVKLYADEEDHAFVRSLQSIVMAEISRVEVAAALWRKVRVGEIDAQAAAVLVRAFVADHEGTLEEEARFQVVLTTSTVMRRAARLCGLHPLRAYDAVQLASAVTTAEEGGEAVSMVAYDHQLRTASAREGVSVVP